MANGTPSTRPSTSLRAENIELGMESEKKKVKVKKVKEEERRKSEMKNVIYVQPWQSRKQIFFKKKNKPGDTSCC